MHQKKNLVLKLFHILPAALQLSVWVFPYSSKGADWISQSVRFYLRTDHVVFMLCFSVLKKDPYHSSCLPVHISCLVELKKVNSK
jgi:hypothetical protein